MKQILSLALFLFLFSCSSDELAGLDSEIDVEKTSVLDRNLSDCIILFKGLEGYV